MRKCFSRRAGEPIPERPGTPRFINSSFNLLFYFFLFFFFSLLPLFFFRSFRVMRIQHRRMHLCLSASLLRERLADENLATYEHAPPIRGLTWIFVYVIHHYHPPVHKSGR